MSNPLDHHPQPDYSILFEKFSEQPKLVQDMREVAALFVETDPWRLLTVWSDKHSAAVNASFMNSHLVAGPWTAEVEFDSYVGWQWCFKSAHQNLIFAIIEGAPDPQALIDKVLADRAARVTTLTNADLGRGDGRI